MRCSPLKVNERFGRAGRLHLQDRWINQERNLFLISASCWFLASNFRAKEKAKQEASMKQLCLLLFNPEDVGDIFLRNLG
jgi:hypothetical protein